MPYEEQRTTGQNCSWEIRAAAYDWAQERVRDWYLNYIIKPVMKVADGAWIDGDGPNNGAWMCSGSFNYGHLRDPYPALNVTEISSFCEGEAAVVTAAQKWLIANGGYDYKCFTFIKSKQELPNANDTSDACAAKLRRLSQIVPPSAVVLYGDRISGGGYDDETATQAVAVFLLTRAEHWFFGYPGANDLNATTAALLLSDFGAPLGNMTQPDPETNVFARKYENATISFDCSTFTAKITQ